MIDLTVFDKLIPNASTSQKNLVIPTLELFGNRVLDFATQHEIRIELIGRHRYIDCSQALRKAEIDVDAWPCPPAGLFVLQERTAYLRSTSPMTIAHEFGHAFDCALGNGSYFSLLDRRVRTAYTSAKSFITPYAAIGPDEFFAEAFRAWFECNDNNSPWPNVSRERLQRVSPAMFKCLADCVSRCSPARNHPQAKEAECTL